LEETNSMTVPNHSSWAEQLTTYRQRAGLSKTRLARAAGVSVGYITKLEAGQKPPPETKRAALAELLYLTDDERRAFHIQAELERTDPTAVKYLLGLIGSAPKPQARTDHGSHGEPDQIAMEHSMPAVPIINKVAAGYPQDFTDLDYPVGVADDYVALPDVTDPNAFAFYVHGDSMEPDFRPGDLLIASPNSAVFEGDPCFVRFSPVSRTSGCTFKRVYFTPAGRIRLVAINQRYPEQVYDRDDINGLWPVIRHYSQVRRSRTKSYRRKRKSGGPAPRLGGDQASSAAG